METTSEVLDVGGPSQDWWDARMRSCENHGESGNTASRTFKGEMRNRLFFGEFDDTAVRDLESSPRTEMEVHCFPESGLEFISRPVKERWKVARCPQECWRDQLRTYGDEPHTQSCEGSWGEQRVTCGDELQAHHHPEEFGGHVAWTFEGEREIHHQGWDTWDVRGEIGDIVARTLEDSLRAHHRPEELQETVLRTLEGLIHDQLEDRWRSDGETSGSELSGDRRKRSRETIMEVHENGVRRAHHSGGSENLKRDRDIVMRSTRACRDMLKLATSERMREPKRGARRSIMNRLIVGTSWPEHARLPRIRGASWRRY